MLFVQVILRYLADFLVLTQGCVAWLAGIFTIAGAVFGLHKKRTRIRLSIYEVSNIPGTLDRMLSYLLYPDTTEYDFVCRFINNSGFVRHVDMQGYLFHFGTDISCGCTDPQATKRLDVSRLYQFCKNDIDIEPGKSYDIGIHVVQHLFVCDDQKFARKCVSFGNFLSHDMILVEYTSLAHFKSILYYDVQAKRILSLPTRLKYYCTMWFQHICNVFKTNHDKIPNNACVNISVLEDGFRDIDLTCQKVLANCGDFEYGAFYRYLHNKHGKTFICTGSKRYEKPDDMHIFDDHEVFGWIGGWRLVSSLPECYCTGNMSMDFNLVDFRHPAMRAMLKDITFVTTCPPKSLIREYVDQLIEYRMNFRLLVTYDDILYFGSKLLIDGDTFDALFYVPRDFAQSDECKRHRMYHDKNGEPMIKVKNCCWAVPNYESEEDKNNDPN